MMIYYIEIITDNGEKVAGELEVDGPIEQKDLIQKVMEFASDNGICPSWAVSNCKYAIR